MLLNHELHFGYNETARNEAIIYKLTRKYKYWWFYKKSSHNSVTPISWNSVSYEIVHFYLSTHRACKQNYFYGVKYYIIT